MYSATWLLLLQCQRSWERSQAMHLIAKGLLRWSIPVDVAVSCHCRRPRIYMDRSHGSRLENKVLVRVRTLTCTNPPCQAGRKQKNIKTLPKGVKENYSQGYKIPVIYRDEI